MTVPGVVERLYPASITRQNQRIRSLIIKRKGKHAVEPGEGFCPPFFIGMEDRLGIRMRTIAMTFCFQFPSKCWVIVELAVIDDPNIACFIDHRLVASRTQVNNA